MVTKHDFGFSHSKNVMNEFESIYLIFAVKVGIPEFLNGVGGGVEAHVAKLESEIGDVQKLLVTRTLKLKKLGVPCKHVIFFFFFPILNTTLIIYFSVTLLVFHAWAFIHPFE